MKRLLTGVLALALLTGTAAMAQPDRGDHPDQRYGQGAYDQDRGAANGYGHRDERYGSGHHWARGQRLPQAYYQDRTRYVDYRSHHLRRPSAGYRWVRTDDNNYALVAVTSGLIASIIAANR
ncbi:MAG TPA: RcnB family protein [Phenylobacterium sp.]|uniref:RcnB family protein n=1 Tax=Phenylobacterium sp. TaxID=1871053 RepID=UPI002BD5898D|nr:RcnB family protein [Phenylobacterium sp.]HSV03890.1 RcnB family protein [Phenylobacterium sp.]